MRIMLLTGDRETARHYRAAAETTGTVRLCAVRNAAEAMERLYREPFDALLSDDPCILHPRLCKCFAHRPDPVCLLLKRPLENMRIPAELTFCFSIDSDPKNVLDRIASFPSKRYRNITVEMRISQFLQLVGVPVSMRGFDCMRAAIRLLLLSDRIAEAVTVTDLYRILAALFHTNAAVIEHAIRHAIDTAWIRADIHTLERIFGNTIDAERAAPSNAAFLFRAADHIKMHREEET